MIFTDTISNLTMISITLGIFFMSAAFYKSIFHKRRTPAKNASSPAFRSDETVRLGDPFQTPAAAGNRNAAPFLEFPTNFVPTVSAFRQISSAWGGTAVGGGSAQTETYEWE